MYLLREAFPVNKSRFMAAVPRCSHCRKFLSVTGTAKELNGEYWHNKCYFEVHPEHKKYYGKGGRVKDSWVITCDGCGSKTLDAAVSEKKARRGAKQLGWAREAGMDYCLNCKGFA